MKRRHLLLFVTLLLLCCHRSFSIQLSGVYTIDSSLTVGTATSFKNFTSAVAYLSGTGSRNDGGPANTAPFGISGPVTFNVKSGTYTEQVAIPAIPGGSNGNRIIFQSLAAKADSVILQFSSPVATGNSLGYTIDIGTNSFISLKYITINALNAAFPDVITMSGSASYNEILNCKINSPVRTSVGGIGLIFTSSIGIGNVIKYNAFNGGSRAINSGSFNVRADMLVIDSNVFSNHYEYSIYVYFTKNLKVRGNTISINAPTSTSAAGMYLYYCDSALEVTNNKITANIGGGTGIFVNTSVTPAGVQRSIVANNTVIMTGGSNGSVIGIKDQSQATNRDFIHNSVSITSPNSNSAAVFGVNYTLGLCKNNIFACNGPGFAAFNYSGSGANSNYNIFYTTGTFLMNKVAGGGNYINLVNWQAAMFSDSNSFFEVPSFVDANDLHLKSGCRRGYYASSVPNDLDGTVRLNPPVIGAYEYAATINNLAVSAISAPSGAYSTGIQDLGVRVRNEGVNAIGSFNIAYELNGAAPVVQLWSTLLNQCDTALVTFPGVPLTAVNSLKIYTSLPNGLADGDRSNDTLNITSFAGLNGTYTIGGSAPDFATFNAATTQLRNVGVSGPVIFEVRNGTYTEQFGFSASIKGANATNTITFRSQSGIADSVKLVSNNYGGTNNYIINIGPASYITIQNLSFNTSFNSSKEYYTAIRLTGDNTNTRGLPSPSFNNIIGCKFIFNGTTADGLNGNSNGFITIDNYGMNNTIRNNTFTSGAMAIQANYLLQLAGQGPYPGPIADGLTIDSNTFINQYYSSIYIVYINNLKIRGNTVSVSTTSPNGFNGILAAGSDSAIQILGNKVNVIYLGAVGGYGIYLGSCKATATARGLIANNSVVLSTNSATYLNGIVEGSGDNHSYYNNSVNIINPNGTSGIAAAFTPISGGNCIAKNNIFKISGVGSALSTGTGAVSDYNQIYATGTFLLPTYTNLLSYQTATGQDLNSINVIPDFIADNDLHLSNGSFKGAFVSNVTKDIEGITRANPPVVGAYEYVNLNNNIIVRGILQPGFPFSGGSQDLKVIVQNVGANPVTSYNVSFVLNAASPVTKSRSVSLAVYAYDTVIFSGVNFTSVNNLTVYSSLPNGVPDADRSTDTLRAVKYSALIGTYTIGIPGDYATFTAASADLTLRGISGAVTFNIAAGSTFTEPPIVFSNITGNTAYPITFRKNGTGSNPVIYGKAGVGGSDAVIKIQGLNNMTFNGIDVQDSASNATTTSQMEFGYNIINSATSGSSGNTIKNCNIGLKRINTATIGLAQYSNSLGGSIAATLNGNNANNNNRYENIKVTNSYGGISLGGTITVLDTNNVITSTGGDTTIIGGINADDIGNGSAGVYGIQVQSQKNVEVSKCIIRNLKTTNATINGIFISNSAGATTLDIGNAIVKNNMVYNLVRANTTTTIGAYGILVNLNTNARADVMNNVVHSIYTANPTAANANQVVRGIAHCVAGNGSANYYHNMVKIGQDTALNASSAAFWKGGTSTTTTVRNNMFINTTADQAGVAKHYAYYINTVVEVPSSNNLLWSAKTNGFIGYATSDRLTLSDFRGARGQEKGSLVYLPNLTAAANLKPNIADTTSWALNGRGIHLSLTSGNSDIQGNVRPAFLTNGVPDIGAYEFTPTSLPPLAKGIPATITSNPSVDTVQVFLFGEDTVCKIKWYANSSISPAPQIRRYSGTLPPSTPGANNRMFAYNTVSLPKVLAPAYSIDFYYQNEWLGDIANETGLTIAHQVPQNPWQIELFGVGLDSNANIIRTSTAYSDTLFTITGTNIINPLPVKLLSLAAQKSGNDILLNWQTASETNSNSFEVERSFDGKQFSKVGNVKAGGNSNKPLSYYYNDADPRKNRDVATIYYRLRIVDNDGQSEYSKTVSVKWDDVTTEPEMTIFPNPFSDEVYLSLLSGGATTLKAEIIDITGRNVGMQEFTVNKGTNMLKLNTADMNSGVYFVILGSNGIRSVRKIVKQ